MHREQSVQVSRPTRQVNLVPPLVDETRPTLPDHTRRATKRYASAGPAPPERQFLPLLPAHAAIQCTACRVYICTVFRQISGTLRKQRLRPRRRPAALQIPSRACGRPVSSTEQTDSSQVRKRSAPWTSGIAEGRHAMSNRPDASAGECTQAMRAQAVRKKCARLDSNQRPHACQACTLTN